MKKIILLIALSIVTACATYTSTQPYRSESGDKYQITGRVEELSYKTQIEINGETVIDGQLSAWDGSGSLSGNYQGEPVMLNCVSTVKGAGRELFCQVFISGDHAANLTF